MWQICDRQHLWWSTFLSCSWFSKVANFNLPHLHLVPPVGVTRCAFCWDFWHHKSRVSLVIMRHCLHDPIRLAVTFSRTQTCDGRTHDYGIYRSSMTSCRKKHKQLKDSAQHKPSPQAPASFSTAIFHMNLGQQFNLDLLASDENLSYAYPYCTRFCLSLTDLHFQSYCRYIRMSFRVSL